MMATTGRRDLLPPLRAALEGRYTVERELAHGGAARVFFGRDREGTPVALKVLHPELQVGCMADRFLREIRLVSRTDHPRIAPVLDSGEHDWIVWFAMPYVEGPTLRARLERERRLDVAETLRTAGELLDALGHAHQHGIVHRDVKPENIVLSAEGAVLLDFGIARAIEVSASEQLTRSGIAVGTSAYMSPEQISAERAIDGRADLYGLACVLFEMLAGRPPFTGRSESAVLYQHLNEPAPDVRRWREDAPAGLAEALAVALARRREARWPTAAAMAAAIG